MVWESTQNNKSRQFEILWPKEMMDFSNYRVKTLLDLVKILQIAFFW